MELDETIISRKKTKLKKKKRVIGNSLIIAALYTAVLCAAVINHT